MNNDGKESFNNNSVDKDQNLMGNKNPIDKKMMKMITINLKYWQVQVLCQYQILF